MANFSSEGKNMKTVYVKVAVQIPEELESEDVISEADYSFSYNDTELETEIISVDDE